MLRSESPMRHIKVIVTSKGLAIQGHGLLMDDFATILAEATNLQTLKISATGSSNATVLIVAGL